MRCFFSCMKTFLALALFATAAVRASEPPPVAGESRFARFGTNRVHYVVTGRGRLPVVLIHGWTGEIDWWRHQVPALTGRAKLILIDLPGHGRSDKPGLSYTMEFYADAVDAVLRDAKIEQAVLAGFSMGSPVMSRFYRDHPSKVLGLISIDGALRPFKLTPEQIEGFIAPMRAENYKEVVGKFLDGMFPNL